MLVLTRRPNESIIIANNIRITVVSVGPGRVKLGIEAPPDVRVDRKEIHDKIEQGSDVLAAVRGTRVEPDVTNTVVSHGSDTAVIVAANAPEAAAPAPAGNFQTPRKPR
jgi:carbon storage regulator